MQKMRDQKKKKISSKIKIKQLTDSESLIGRVLFIPLYKRKEDRELLPKMIIKSGWIKGLWCVKKIDDERVYPVFFDSFDEVKEWYIEKR